VAAATSKPPRRVEPAWAALRPVLIAFLLAADTATVVSLALVRPDGFVAPLIAFSLALAGLIGLEAWAIAHRHDDDSPARR
jgi:hypothetical protein